MFINFLVDFTTLGAPFNRRKLELKCVAECEPTCTISWFRNQVSIESLNSTHGTKDRFEIRSFNRLPLKEKNLLSHVESVLEIDFYHYEDEELQSTRDNTNYTCKASGNDVGTSIESQTTFRIHYPPRNIAVSPR